jgi:SAM-dependent methyltransferase
MAAVSDNRWLADTGGTSGEAYADRFARLAASGADLHGEARLVSSLLAPGARILDAGCGTGRVAIELDRQGFDVVGVDIDESMLAVARREAPHLSWLQSDLAGADLAGHAPFDAVVLAGNVLIYVAPGSEGAVLVTCAAVLRPGGVVVAGFQLRHGGYDLQGLDADADAAGLDLVDRWATWDREAYHGGDYAVSFFRRRPS